MSRHFTIQHEWLHSGQATQPEQATQADISIWVDETCLTENISRFGEIPRQSACLSTLHLSRWFADNWWRLLWEPYDGRTSQEWQTSHRAGAAGGGYLWPDLSFSSDWNTVLVSSTPTIPSTAEPIHYSREYNGFIPAASFEQGIENFVNSTMERLTTVAPAYRELANLWEEVNRERNDPQSAEWRKLEACLGHDPDDAPDELLEKLFGEYDRYGASVVQELAAASRDNALNHLHTVTEDIQRRGTGVKVSQYKDIRKLLSNRTGSSEELPWQRAAHAAGIARDVWGLPGGPVPNGELSEIFGFHLQDHQPGEQSNAQRLPFHAGLRDDKIEDGFLISLDQRHINSRRFTLVRLAADYLDTQGDEPLLPATRASTSRQKFQRAFAQEFLCPIENLKDFLEGTSISDDDINEAAAYFEVSPLTIKTTLVNKGHLAREQVFGEWAV